jgi:hypothetical protein
MTLFAAAALALGLATAAAAADAGGPYKLDAKGKCHDAKGGFTSADKCKPPAPAKPAKCKDASGKFAKCGTPGAKPVS